MNRHSSVSGRYFCLAAFAALFLVLFLLCSLAACGYVDRDLPNNEERPSTDNPPADTSEDNPNENPTENPDEQPTEDPDADLPLSTQYLEYLPLPDGSWAVSAGKAKLLDKIVIPAVYQGKAVTKMNDIFFTRLIQLHDAPDLGSKWVQIDLQRVIA